MSIKILWHRQYAGFAISGLCEKEKKQYWFEWDFQNDKYRAYHLHDGDYEKLEKELETLRKSYGDVIFHDERYKPILSEESGFKTVEVADIDNKTDNFAFFFGKSNIENPIPHQIYYKSLKS